MWTNLEVIYTEWSYQSMFPVIGSSLLGLGAVIFAEANTIFEKYGAAGFLIVVAGLLGKYFAFRPSTIKAMTEAEVSKATTIQQQHKELIDQINAHHKLQTEFLVEQHKQHVIILTNAIEGHRARAARSEQQLAMSRHIKHEMAQGVNKMGLQMQRWELLLDDAQVKHEPVFIIDTTMLFREEDDNSRSLTNQAMIEQKPLLTNTGLDHDRALQAH